LDIALIQQHFSSYIVGTLLHAKFVALEWDVWTPPFPNMQFLSTSREFQLVKIASSSCPPDWLAKTFLMEWSVFQWLLQIQLMIILVLQLVGGYVISHFVLTFCIEKVLCSCPACNLWRWVIVKARTWKGVGEKIFDGFNIQWHANLPFVL
jgi:hypothetical protein